MDWCAVRSTRRFISSWIPIGPWSSRPGVRCPLAARLISHEKECRLLPFALECDTCDFVRHVDDEVDAYTAAKDHESEHGDHFVYVEERTEAA